MTFDLPFRSFTEAIIAGAVCGYWFANAVQSALTWVLQ